MPTFVAASSQAAGGFFRFTWWFTWWFKWHFWISPAHLSLSLAGQGSKLFRHRAFIDNLQQLNEFIQLHQTDEQHNLLLLMFLSALLLFCSRAVHLFLILYLETSWRILKWPGFNLHHNWPTVIDLKCYPAWRCAKSFPEISRSCWLGCFACFAQFSL